MDSIDAFYDEQYYLGHYDRERTNPEYYHKISQFWKYNIFDSNSIVPDGVILDYGAGLGQVSAGIGAECYDFSPFARKFLKDKGRKVFDSPDEINRNYYDFLLSSHCLEHVRNPLDELIFLKTLLKRNGTLVLIVPIEPMPGKPVFETDDNKHYYNWNFQSMTNVLIEAGYKIKIQQQIFGPFALSKLTNLSLVKGLGKLKGNFPSILTMASPAS